MSNKNNSAKTALSPNLKLFMAALGVAAISTSAVALDGGADTTKQDKPSAKKEKCYGIVKAGNNDCAASDGSHSCANLAKNDSEGKEWVLVPAGTCSRIVGGSVTPIIQN